MGNLNLITLIIFFQSNYRDRLRTSINVLGDAYGCGIVEHLSRSELRKLDEEAEAEFAQIIAKSHENTPEPHSSGGGCGGGGGGGGYTGGTSGGCSEAHPFMTSRDMSNMNIQDEKRHSQQQFEEFKSFDGGQQRRLSNRSQASIHQQAPLAQPDPTGTSTQQLQQPTPSIVVMDALRRRSRQLLFTNTKLPVSVNSMPQISIYQQHQKHLGQQQQQQPSTSNNNQDTNV